MKCFVKETGIIRFVRLWPKVDCSISLRSFRAYCELTTLNRHLWSSHSGVVQAAPIAGLWLTRSTATPATSVATRSAVNARALAAAVKSRAAPVASPPALPVKNHFVVPV